MEQAALDWAIGGWGNSSDRVRSGPQTALESHACSPVASRGAVCRHLCDRMRRPWRPGDVARHFWLFHPGCRTKPADGYGLYQGDSELSTNLYLVAHSIGTTKRTRRPACSAGRSGLLRSPDVANKQRVQIPPGSCCDTQSRRYPRQIARFS